MCHYREFGRQDPIHAAFVLINLRTAQTIFAGGDIAHNMRVIITTAVLIWVHGMHCGSRYTHWLAMNIA